MAVREVVIVFVMTVPNGILVVIGHGTSLAATSPHCTLLLIRNGIACAVALAELQTRP